MRCVISRGMNAHGKQWLNRMACLIVLALAGCGGGGNSSSSSSSSTSSSSSSSSSGSSASTYTIGGTVSGLRGLGLVLHNNGGDNLSISASSNFTFSTALASGSAYAVTVFAQPANPTQTCSVTNGSSTVATANVSNVIVNCVDATTMPRGLHTATLLPSGLVLITGGIIGATVTATDTAELYDPAANTFTALANTMSSPRNQHTATLLPNGKVLIAGGSNNREGDGMDTAELYDPATQTFTPIAAKMAHRRGGHTATLLNSGPNSGMVLLASGFYDGTPDASAELYDPAGNSFAAITATMTTGREAYAATLLANGKVLLTGGSTTGAPFASAEIYDPIANTFTALSATMTTARGVHTATLQSDGQVLITGGVNQAYSPTNIAPLTSAELYDPVANTFTASPFTLGTARGGHTATLLPSGKLLFIGGVTGNGGPYSVLNTVEAYGP